ncbi:hypothetical protein SDC9_152239 [bioreactor metagenome]|uniref:Uncharacterized protein n=1 Tax=bioreactor metagenome TaxID=1076179 RepID=A0A645EU74_9ZZZZ
MTIDLALIVVVLQRVLRPHLKGINGNGFPFNQIQLFKQKYKLAKDCPELFGIVFTEICNGFIRGYYFPQQPTGFDIEFGFPL